MKLFQMRLFSEVPMKKKINKAFTLAEVVVSMSILIIVTAMVIPTVRRAMPNTDAIKFKQVYQGVLMTINSMLADARIYPDVRGFGDTSAATDSLGISYANETKFQDFFISKLNVIDDNVDTGGGEFVYGVWEDGTPVTDTEFKCVKVNTGSVFCLPPDVDVLNPRRPNSDAAVYVRVYLQDEDFSERKAFFIAVRSNGRVYLPTRGVGFDCSVISGGRMRDRDFNQCIANEYLSSSTMPEISN